MHVLSVHSHNIRHTTRTVLSVCFALGLFLMLASVASAAQIVITPQSGSYAAGQTFTATVAVNPEGKSVNAVEANLTFDAARFSVVSISKTGSAFSLWTTEPTFSNTAGTISFGGGSPTPFSGRSTLVSITLRALTEGTGNIRVSSGSVLAADGLGTDVYTGASNAAFTITGAPATPPPVTPPPQREEPQEEEEPEEQSAITFGDPPRAPEAGSTTFLDPEVWYATKTGIFTWEIPFDVTEIALDIATSADAVPTTKYKPPIETISLNDTLLRDGIQYLTLQYRNQVGWGAILHRKLMIDTLPPEPFTINVRAGNAPTAFPLITFAANDTTSGIDRYEMTIAGGEPIVVTPDEAKLGYLLGNLVDGTYTITVTAYDKAGNTTVATVPVLITAGWQPPVEVVVASSIFDIFKGKNLVIIILILIILAQFAYSMMQRRQHEQREQKLRKETKEIQDQMEKIFSALRDEIYDQINMITKRERLSKKEKEAVEGLNQALEVSETLIEKEITDVSKILK